MKIGRRQNLSISSFLPVFVGYSTQFWAPGAISTASDAGYRKIGTSSKLVDLVISDRFLAYSTQFLAPGMISTAGDPRYTKIRMSSKLVDFFISGRFHEL